MFRSLAYLALLAAVCPGQNARESFEVASVKLHDTSATVPVVNRPGVNPIRISGSRVTVERINLKDLIAAAYGVKNYQVSGGPAWANGIDNLWDISARTEGGAPDAEQVRFMLQGLLAERFQLKLRRESRQLPVYNLVAGRNGAKLKEVAPDAPPPAENMRRGSMEQIAGLLGLFLDRPVIDKTGLAGIYDYPSNLERLDMDRGATPDPAAVAAAALAAVQDQLGLKAEPGRATVEILVIDSAGKPTEN